MITRECKTCKKEFQIYPCRLKKEGRGIFCSISCSLFGQKRHSIPHTDEAKKKISQNTGMNKGKYAGERHWNWKGGLCLDKAHMLALHYLRTRRRLLKKRGAEGNYSFEEWGALVEKYNNCCAKCRISGNETRLEADHIVPISLGGSNYITNIQPLCRSCNASKHTKVIKYELVPA